METKSRLAATLMVCLLVAVGCTDPDAPKNETPGSTLAVERGAWLTTACDLPAKHVDLIAHGNRPGRSPDIALVPSYPNFFGTFAVTTHSGPWNYLQRVPIAFYGPGHIRAQGRMTAGPGTTVADIAPTLAELVGLDWPDDRPGRVLDEVLLPAEERPTPPKLVVFVVWDGGGWNVLDNWPRKWPTLKRLGNEGSLVTDAVVGSSPSVTPAVHATFGAGAFPEQHGITDIWLRDGQDVRDSYQDSSPDALLIPSFADLFDQSVGNASFVGMIAERGWHLGMMGHGAGTQGGDKDVAVLTKEEEIFTNSDFYSLPNRVRQVEGMERDIRKADAEDGQIDGQWLGHDLSTVKGRGPSPVPTMFQTRLVKELLRRDFGRDAIPDLFFTNYKEIDITGHVFNMIGKEVGSLVRHTDDQLAKIVGFLDNKVGEQNWVLALTADHGQGPDPLSFGAWPMNINELVADVAKEFGSTVEKLIQAKRPTGLFFDPKVLKAKNIKLERIADFLTAYRLRDNATTEIRSEYEDRAGEKLFAGAFPYNRIDEIQECTRSS